MSGIGLIWHRQGNPVDPRELQNIADALRLNRPATPSIKTMDGVGFVSSHPMTSRKADLPRQPVCAGEGRWQILFDGRLDHRMDLTQALGMSASDALTIPDAVLAARAWSAWGESGLERWFGEFACIVWDGERRDLRLFCDPFGRRPLHYFADAKRIVVSSMPRGIHAVSGIDRIIDREKIADVACGLYLHRSQSCFVGIRSVEAGELVRFTPDAVQSRFFYNLEDHIKPVHYATDDQYAEAMTELLEAAVANTIRPGENAAVAMSGGLDSTSVAVVATAHLSEAQSCLPVYTMVPDPEWDGLHETHVFANEAHYARAVADHCPALQLNLVDAEGRGIFDVLDRVHGAMEMPQINIMNLIWIDSLFAKAKLDGATVLLNGEMGNVGFSHCGSGAASQLLRSWDISGLTRQLLAEAGGSVFGAAKKIPRIALGELQAAIPTTLRAKLLKRQFGSSIQVRSRVLRDEYIAEMKVFERALAKLTPDLKLMTGRMTDNRLLALKHHLFAALGVIISGCSALHEIDFRDPLADRKLMEWSLGVPEKQFRRQGEKRGLTKHAMRGRLPDEVLYKPIDRGRQSADWHVRLSRDLDRIRAEFDRFSQDPELAAMLDLNRLQGFLADWPARTPTDQADPRFAIRNEIPSALSIGRFLLDSS